MDTLYLSTTFIAIISNLILGVLVFLRDKRKFLNLIFFLMTISISMWLLSIFFSDYFKSINLVLFFIKLANVSAVWALYFFIYFTFIFPKPLGYYFDKIKAYYFILPVIFSLLLFSNLIIKGVKIEEWGSTPVLGPIAFLYSFGYLLGTIIFVFFNLITQYKKNVSFEKLQLKYVSLGIGLTIILAFLISVIIPIITRSAETAKFSSLTTIFFIIFTAFAITRYHLFEIRVILTELLVVVIGIILLILPFSMPTNSFKILTAIIFILFCFFGYLLIKATHEEVKRREEIESLSEELKISNIRLNSALKDLKKSYKKLKRLDEAKTQFLSIASHQLRTPLSVIKGYLSMVLSGEYGSIDKKPKRFLNNVYKSTERLIGLVSDFLNISRLQLGEMKFNFEKLQLEEIVRSVVNEFSHTAKEKKLYLTLKKPNKEMPEIQADRQKIRQVVLNLIDNAIKYTKGGGVTVEVKNLKNKCQLIVEDTGIGMNEDELDRTFKMFERGMEAVLTCPDGSGVGLFVARQIVKAHNGKLRVESKGRGKGSKFVVELPCA